MNSKESEFDRREFLRVIGMGSAAAMIPTTLFARTNPQMRSYARLAPLAPGAVQPEGWLRLYLEKQARELGSQLPKVSWPFTGAYWAGEEQAESWWPWEQCAYWIDGATRLSLVLNDAQLLQQVRERLEYTLTHPIDGYLGPRNFSDPKGDFHRWPHAIFFRALAALSDSQQRSDIAEAMRLHYLSDKASYSEPTRNIINIESILWCYSQTGDAQLLAMAENAWRGYQRVAADPEHGDLSELRVYSAAPITSHGVTYIETSKQPAALYMYTGNEDHLKFALAAQRRIFDHHMLIDGIPSTTEDYRTRTSLDSHETCDITDHAWAWSYMLRATGDGVWADHIERACFNAGMGAIKKDWKALQYFSCPNQFLATLNSDHNVLIHGGRLMAFQPNPGQDSACCGANVHRLFPNYVIGMWMKEEDGLVATLYGPSKLRTRIGEKQRELEVDQETDYPFGEKIDFVIRTAQPIDFPLSLRIPQWCTAPRVSINGKIVDVARVENGFVRLRREFRMNDRISLILPMQFATSRWPQHGIALEHGPLVYSLPIDGKWSPVVEQKYSSAEFPNWNVVPTSVWNYGLNTRAKTSDLQATLRRRAMTPDPWVDPPVTVSVAARGVEGWNLQENPDDPAQRFTPPLPDASDVKAGEVVSQLELVPYGATHLRLTIFPELVTGGAPEDMRRRTSG